MGTGWRADNEEDAGLPSDRLANTGPVGMLDAALADCLKVIVLKFAVN